MKFILIVGVLVTFPLVNANGRNKCKLVPSQVPTDWITMVDTCAKKIKDQIMQELTAAMTYMAMGAHFSKATVNRPGFAKMFFEAASEERQHAIKLIEYLLMRGDLLKDHPIIDSVPVPVNSTWPNGQDALNEALRLEAKVTRLIIEIIKECEEPDVKKKVNDYHLVDYLSGDFLEEQYRGQSDLAGKSSTLGKMLKNHGVLGEFLFDKKLLHGEL